MSRDTFVGVARQHVGDLVADDGCQLVLILGDLKQPGVDADVAARQREGIGGLILEYLDLPAADAIASGHLGGHRIRHAADVGILTPFHHRQLLLVLAEAGFPHLLQFLVRVEGQLAAAQRRAGAGTQGDGRRKGRQREQTTQGAGR